MANLAQVALCTADLPGTLRTFVEVLGFADAGNDAKGTTTRSAYDLMAEGFGPGSNGPVIVVGDTSTPVKASPAPVVSTFDHLLLRNPPLNYQP